jgi:hypothetical protein
MPYKKLSGMQRLRKAQADRAERKRRKIASEKKGKDELTPHLTPLPSRPKLRTATPAQRRRISKPKGGQRLMDLAKRRKPAVKKKPASSQPRKFGARIPVGSRSPATKAQQPKRKAGVAPRNLRTPAQRDTDRARLKNLQSEARSMSNLATSQAGDLGKAERATWEAIVGLATAPLAALKGVHGAYKAKKAADLAKAAAKAKRAATAAKKAAEAKKGVSGIGAARAESALARTSGLGKTPKPKPKPKKKKKSAAQTKRESMRGASQWR